MYSHSLFSISLTFLPLLLASASPSPSHQILPRDSASACASLASQIAIENVTVQFTQFVAAGTNISIGYDGAFNTSTCGYTGQVTDVELCRVAMAVATSPRSGITLEAWLPTNWTGRFLSTGNGGLGGCIQYVDLAYGANLGFAVVGANNGHNGTGGEAFLNNPDIIQDFAERSMHTGVVVGKQVTEQYYETAYNKSYYLGCSTGGREGFKAVQTFPDDFDGVVAGSPAFAFNELIDWSGHFFTIFGNESAPTYVPAGSLWTAIHDEILNQCDGIDGVVDGIIEDPALCSFRPESLLCGQNATNTSSCLTGPQAVAVGQAFSPYYGIDGKLIYPAMNPGSEALAQLFLYTGGLFTYTLDWFRYVVYNDSSFNPPTFTVQDAQAAIDQNPFNIATFEGDLSAFQQSGGKVITYHGGADFLISSFNSPRYYNHVADTMSMTSDELDDFYRFFRISGMGHCNGGDGASFFGQQLPYVSELNPQNNVLLRIVDWVENGNAPETITGTKYVNDDPTEGVSFVRNHCKYPKRNFCIDPANYTSPDAWECID